MNSLSKISYLVSALGMLLLSACAGSHFSLPSQTNTFQEIPLINNKVDILFVADDSVGMIPYRQALAAESQSMITQLNALGMDYQIAVTTTSVGASYAGGTFVGSPSILTNSTPNLAAALSTNLDFSLPGSQLQQGLTSMELALSPPYSSGQGKGFVRPDAMLAVIVLSSDDDFSTGSVASFQSFLQGLKPPFADGKQSWVVNYIGTTSLNAACSQFPALGSRYMQLVTASNGISQNICNANWAFVMTNLQVVISTLMTQFFFTTQPNPATIQVTVNGNVVPQSSVNGWSYMTGTNASGATTYYIQFNGTAIPNVYASINVTFTPASAK